MRPFDQGPIGDGEELMPSESEQVRQDKPNVLKNLENPGLPPELWDPFYHNTSLQQQP